LEFEIKVIIKLLLNTSRNAKNIRRTGEILLNGITFANGI